MAHELPGNGGTKKLHPELLALPHLRTDRTFAPRCGRIRAGARAHVALHTRIVSSEAPAPLWQPHRGGRIEYRTAGPAKGDAAQAGGIFGHPQSKLCAAMEL